MQHRKTFGKYIKTLREKTGLSLNSFAYQNGLDSSTLSRIENGIIDPKYTTLSKIAKGLNMTASELLRGFEENIY